MPHGIAPLAPGRRVTRRFTLQDWLAIDVEINFSPAASERLLLTLFAGHGWVAMFGAGLPRKENQFLGTDSVCVDISHQLKPGRFQLTQPEIRHLYLSRFLRRQNDAGSSKILSRTPARRLNLFLCEHCSLPPTKNAKG